MRLTSTVPPFHYPEPEQQSVMRLGLQPLDMGHWMHCDSDFAQFLAHKRQVQQQHPELAFAALDQSLEAQREFSTLLKAHLLRDYGQVYSQIGDALQHGPTQTHWDCTRLDLVNSQYWVQEDICLLQLEGAHYRLTAASVCSPSNWALEKKIGRSVDEIHQPVPGYQASLAERVNRLLRGLKPNKPMLRFNWSLQHGNELFLRNDLDPPPGEEKDHWRVERQTLVKLPRTEAIVFGIRIFLHALDALGSG
ncbi:MAG: DUF3445 domain-containing protein, partial [Gammaproteobacteria bacterium]